MGKLRSPARPLYQNPLKLDETIITEEASEDDDYHNYVFFWIAKVHSVC